MRGAMVRYGVEPTTPTEGQTMRAPRIRTRNGLHSVTWETTAGETRTRPFKHDLPAAQRFRAWRVLNPDAPDTAYDRPIVEGNVPRGMTLEAVWDRYRQVINYTTAKREATDASFWTNRIAVLPEARPLGKRPVRTLRKSDIVEFEKAMFRATKGDGSQRWSDRTRSDTMVLLRALLRFAVDEDWAESNVAEGVTVAVADLEVTDSDVFTVAELEAVIKNATERYAALFRFLGDTGARLSEALAVSREDFDFTAGTVALASPWVAVEDDAGTIKWRDRLPGQTHGGKTRKAKRIVWLLPATLAAVQDHLDRFPILPTDVRRPDGRVPVFRNHNGQVPSQSGLRQQEWNPLLKRAGIGRHIPMRNLRHTAASHMLMANLPGAEYAVAARLGHADASITQRIYARFIPDTKISGQSAMLAWIASQR